MGGRTRRLKTGTGGVHEAAASGRVAADASGLSVDKTSAGIGPVNKLPSLSPKNKLRRTAALAGLAGRTVPAGVDAADYRRRMVADLCRLLGAELRPSALTEHVPRPGRALDSTANSTYAPEITIETTARRPPSVRDTDPPLSPRMTQTLDRLLAGDAEKQIARHLGVSPHTVHVYVKGIYRRFGVSSRGELFARFVRPLP